MDSNNAKAFELIKNHFGLEAESLDTLASLIETTDNFAPEFKAILGENRKVYLDLDLKQLEAIDEAWKFFKAVVPLYIQKYNVSYKNFYENKLSLRGSPKLFKHFIKDYIESFEDQRSIGILIYNSKNKSKEEQANLVVSKINSKKNIHSSNMKLVLSMDLVDWLMCSTAESWSSCYDLNSNYDMSYWSGIPGMFGDKSRILAYITNGETKEFLGLKSDRMISRTFLSYLGDDSVFINRSYPNNLVEEVLKSFKKELPFNFTDLSATERSKYPLKKMYFTNELLCVPYTDRGTYIPYKNELYFNADGDSDFLAYNKENVFIEDIFINFDGGLKSLVSSGVSLSRFFGETDTCDWCCSSFHTDDLSLAEDGKRYCEDCYDSVVGTCDECGCFIHLQNDSANDVEGGVVCEKCIEKLYFYCETCNEFYKITEPHTKVEEGLETNYYCEECYNEMHIKKRA